MAATFSLTDFVRSLTAEQIRKANAAGLPFAELTAEQQQAVSAMWEHTRQFYDEIRAKSGKADIPTPGPVGQVKVALVGYSEMPNANEVLIELRGNVRHMMGCSLQPFPAALKEAGKDLVAAGVVEFVTDQESQTPSPGQ